MSTWQYLTPNPTDSLRVASSVLTYPGQYYYALPVPYVTYALLFSLLFLAVKTTAYQSLVLDVDLTVPYARQRRRGIFYRNRNLVDNAFFLLCFCSLVEMTVLAPQRVGRAFVDLLLLF